MAKTGIQRKISSDLAADTTSTDSLSFAGLVCIQDQCSNPQTGHVLPLPPPKDDPEFEFSHSAPGLTVGSPTKGSPADLLFSNGQLIAQAIQSHSNQSSKVVVHVSSRDLLRPSRGSSSIRSRKSSDSELGFNKAAKKTNNEMRNNQANKDRTKGNGSFGSKILKSFVAPCRSCRAIEPSGPSPSVKVQALQQGNAKLQ